MKVAVLGSSKTKAGEEVYEEAYNLGKALAQAKHWVVNGGYGGVMEAVSRGAKSIGGKVLIATTSDFNIPPHQYFDIEIPSGSYLQRMIVLFQISDAFVIFHGGIGTLNEFFALWCLKQNRLLKKPVILYKTEEWEGLIKNVVDNFEVPEDDIKLFNFAESLEDVLKLLQLTANELSNL